MVALTNARVFDGRSMLPGRHDVTVDGKRVTSIAPHAGNAASEGIDVGGMTVLPGLITCHLHPDFFKFEIGAGDRPGTELPAGVMMAIGGRTCRVLLESGFTRHVGASGGQGRAP